MEGHTTDAQRLRELMIEAGDKLPGVRPEIIGGTFGSAGDGGYVEAVYFTTESEARSHEKITVPDDLGSLFEEEGPLMGAGRLLRPARADAGLRPVTTPPAARRTGRSPRAATTGVLWGDQSTLREGRGEIVLAR